MRDKNGFSGAGNVQLENLIFAARLICVIVAASRRKNVKIIPGLRELPDFRCRAKAVQFGISTRRDIVNDNLRKPVWVVPMLVIEEIPLVVIRIIKKIRHIAIPRDRVSAADIADQVIVDASVARKMRGNVLLRYRYIGIRDAGMVKDVGDNIQDMSVPVWRFHLDLWVADAPIDNSSAFRAHAFIIYNKVARAERAFRCKSLDRIY